jgi:hypothetical protein
MSMSDRSSGPPVRTAIRPGAGLGLADPHHPARKYIDTAAVIADRRLKVRAVGEGTSIETDEVAMRT